MLYLFNSGFYQKYRGNVLNTLHLPRGVSNTCQYTRPHVPPQLLDGPTPSPGTDCLLVFVDRHGEEGYGFLPVRLGTLVAKESDSFQGQLEFEVNLGDYVYPVDSTRFESQLIASLSPLNMPHLSDGNPASDSDGYYVLDAPECYAPADLQIGDSAWERVVDWLLTTRAFSESSGPDYVFTRCSFRQRGRDVAPKVEEPRINLVKGADYVAEFSYRCSLEVAKTMDAAIEVVSMEAVRVSQPPGGFPVDSAHGRARVDVLPITSSECRAGSLRITGHGATVASAAVPFSLSQPLWRKAMLGLLLLAYGMIAAGLVVYARMAPGDSLTQTLFSEQGLAIVALVTGQTFVLAMLVHTTGRKYF